jgi:hypothetical protein
MLIFSQPTKIRPVRLFLVCCRIHLVGSWGAKDVQNGSSLRMTQVAVLVLVMCRKFNTSPTAASIECTYSLSNFNCDLAMSPKKNPF